MFRCLNEATLSQQSGVKMAQSANALVQCLNSSSVIFFFFTINFPFDDVLA